jgi:hypothetical protein
MLHPPSLKNHLHSTPLKYPNFKISATNSNSMKKGRKGGRGQGGGREGEGREGRKEGNCQFEISAYLKGTICNDLFFKEGKSQ